LVKEIPITGPRLIARIDEAARRARAEAELPQQSDGGTYLYSQPVAAA